jgi:murein DD-endopeptidase MepM/ murein hydrolase activator NlpD
LPITLPPSDTPHRSRSPLRLVAACSLLVAACVLISEAVADMGGPAPSLLLEPERSASSVETLASAADGLHVSSPPPGLRHRTRAPISSLSAPTSVVTQGVLRSGESLGPVLRAQGITPAAIHLISQEVRPVFDFRRSQPGHRYRLSQDAHGNVLDFRYTTSPDDSIHLFWDGARFVVRKEQAELTPRVERIAGIVDTSLYAAIAQLGESPQLATTFADLFAWDVDFSRSIQSGDEFQILYERLYRTDPDGYEVYVRPGMILAARFRWQAGNFTAVFYEGDPGPGGYYRPDGTSVERAFLAAPLQFGRVTSRYSSSRRHPILKVNRPHHGIDYAAPEGTPLWAVSDGTVVFKGRNGGFGNLVKVEHANGYTSYYAHLSGYAPGLHVGQTVKQKEVIGYVGHTGLATGPHVCFRVAKNGRYVNPMKLASPPGDPIDEAQWNDFSVERDLLLGQLVSASVLTADGSF